MKQITFKIIGIALFSCLIFWSFKYYFGWLNFKKNTDTPEKYISRNIIKKENYTNDSIEITNRLRILLFNHVDFFYSKAYFNSTSLIIDSILYSEDFNKMVVFVITKNPTYRQDIPDKNHDWYFDATCYLGVRQSDSIRLVWVGPVFTNSNNESGISKNIREACLRNFVSKDSTGDYEFNMNDVRFWRSSIWKRFK